MVALDIVTGKLVLGKSLSDSDHTTCIGLPVDYQRDITFQTAHF